VAGPRILLARQVKGQVG